MRFANLLLITFLALTVSGVVIAQNDDYNPDPSWKVPAVAAKTQNPIASNRNAAKEGKELFEGQCSMCHGLDGTGVSNAANLRLPVVQKQSDGTLFWKITNGHQEKGMPSFKRLPDKERWQLVTYLRTLKGK
jgi:mono/diheme cytochrome c family protein